MKPMPNQIPLITYVRDVSALFHRGMPSARWEKMKVHEKVLWLLENNEYVTTSEFLRLGIFTFSQRMSELRADLRAQGRRIVKRPVKGPTGSVIYSYSLVERGE